jgi:glycerophosphoryl diester phosphodiesterase
MSLAGSIIEPVNELKLVMKDPDTKMHKEKRRKQQILWQRFLCALCVPVFLTPAAAVPASLVSAVSMVYRVAVYLRFPMFRRTDPIFGLTTPILFAHRGGARETAESTLLGFRHALAQRTDVLEMDVQVTKGETVRDQELVVWHGPNLDNVRLASEDDKPHFHRQRRNITDYEWRELRNLAWVADPDGTPEEVRRTPQVPERRLLSFEEFLDAFPNARINVELKRSVKHKHLDRFIGIVRANHPDRVKVVASNLNGRLLADFRRKTRGQIATNVAFVRAAYDRVLASFGALGRKNLVGFAMELPHARWILPVGFIEQVRQAGGSTYAFITGFGPIVKGIDIEPDSPGAGPLFEILDRGVDGIMTDRPRTVRCLMDEWIKAHSRAQTADSP